MILFVETHDGAVTINPQYVTRAILYQEEGHWKVAITMVGDGEIERVYLLEQTTKAGRRWLKWTFPKQFKRLGIR